MRSQGGGFRLAIPTLALCLLVAPGRCGALSPELPTRIPVTRAWEFTDIVGARHSVDWRAQDKGGVLVFFFDLQSPDSLLGLSYFDALFGRARDFGLTMVGIEATGRQAAEVRTLLQGYTAVYKAPGFPVIADPDFAAAKLFGSRRAPTALLVRDRGEIVARRASFDLGVAVVLTRKVEQLLRRSEGFFSPALREVGLSEARERQLGARAEATDGGARAERKALSWGDHLPAFDFTDTAGRSGRWAWPGGAVIRVAFFWSGASAGAAEDLAFFRGLRERSAGEYLEIIAVESTGLEADLLAEILGEFTRRQPALSFPVVPDPQKHLVTLFGAGEPLPQTFLVGVQGEVLYRADGFDASARRVLEEKIVRAVRLADLGLPQAVTEVSRGGARGAEGTEAPSIRRRLERDEALRFNLSQGDYFFSNGQHGRAVLFYQRYLELEPGSLHSLVRLAQIHDLIREPAKAREFWERVLKLRPDHAEGRARLGESRRPAVR